MVVKLILSGTKLPTSVGNIILTAVYRQAYALHLGRGGFVEIDVGSLDSTNELTIELILNLKRSGTPRGIFSRGARLRRRVPTVLFALRGRGRPPSLCL